MNRQRLEEILSKITGVKIIVYGDYFLDNYLTLDRNLSEISLETGLEAYQVIETRKYPGVAGVVAANLHSLGASVSALGLVGDDGNGFELRKKLVEIEVDVSGLIEIPGFATPTYNKPMLREPDGQEHELNRMDVKLRSPLPAWLEDRLIREMNRIIAGADGMLVVDQARGLNCGMVTDRMRDELQRLATANPKKVIVADSRDFLGRYRSVIFKSNLSEALRAAGLSKVDGESASDCAERCGRRLWALSNRPIVITLGEDGIYILEHIDRPGILIPAIPIEGPIDIVGAGDSVNAAVGAALCAGATLEEAGSLGNLVASIVIQQIGVTGTASAAQIIQRYRTYF